jgi:hypothetical protein
MSQADLHSYQVGRHIVRLSPAPEGWSVSVDGLRHGRRYASAAEAWSAGLRTAEGLDRPDGQAATSPPPRR